MQRVSIGLGELAVFAVIAAVYAWNLCGAPPAVSGDEALFAIHGKAIADSGCDRNGDCWPLLVQIQPGQSDRRFYQPLLFYAEAATFSILPVNVATARLPLLVTGFIDILLMYVVGLELTRDRRAALVGALALATSPAHFFHSRQAADYLLPVPFVLAWMFLMLRALRRPAIATAVGMGLVLAAGTFSYIAAWFVMPALLAVSAILLATCCESHKGPMLAALAAGYAALAGPIAIWLMREPDTVAGLLRHYAVSSDTASFSCSGNGCTTTGSSI